MKIFKLLATGMTALVLGIGSVAAQASGGVVHFSGSIVAPTCSMTLERSQLIFSACPQRETLGVARPTSGDPQSLAALVASGAESRVVAYHWDEMPGAGSAGAGGALLTVEYR